METLSFSIMADTLINPNVMQEIEAMLDTLAEAAKSDFEKTMQTWNVHKTPVMIEKSAGKRVVSVTNDIYYYVNFGTEVRRARLSQGFMPKTAVGVIGSVAGSGGMVAVSKKFNFPGIKARRFDLAIIKRIALELPEFSQLFLQRIVP